MLTEKFIHLVTLLNRSTGDEQSFKVETSSNRFTDVLREISHQRVMRKLRGYELFEAIPIAEPVPF